MAYVEKSSSLNAEAAEQILAAAKAKATEMGKPMAIAVVDRTGELKAFVRMDGAPQLSVGIAQDKAYTATSFGISTADWYNFIKDDPPLLHGIVHTPRLVVFGGGIPVYLDGELVGGVGASGGHYTDDAEVAQAGIDALGA